VDSVNVSEHLAVETYSILLSELREVQLDSSLIGSADHRELAI
jgi:hypothetical protein